MVHGDYVGLDHILMCICANRLNQLQPSCVLVSLSCSSCSSSESSVISFTSLTSIPSRFSQSLCVTMDVFLNQGVQSNLTLTINLSLFYIIVIFKSLATGLRLIFIWMNFLSTATHTLKPGFDGDNINNNIILPSSSSCCDLRILATAEFLLN